MASEHVFDACATLYERRCGALRHQPHRADRRSSRSCVADRRAVRARAEGLPAERGLRASSSASSKARRTFRSTRWSSCSSRSPTSSRKDPERRGGDVLRRRERLPPSLNVGRITITLKPFRQRKPADEVVRGLRPKLANVLGAKVFIAERAGDPHRRQADQEPVPVRACAAPTSTSSTTGRRTSSRSCARCRAWSDVTSDLQITRPQVTVEIEREKASALGVSAQIDREGAQQRLRRARRCRPSTPRPTSSG